MKIFFGLLRSSIHFIVFSIPIFCCKAAVYITIVQGLSGETQYQEKFDQQRQLISTASRSLTTDNNIASFINENATRANLLQHFSNMAQVISIDDQIVIYLIGHGSFDGEQYKFNIPGPDLTSVDINTLLNIFTGQNLALVNTSSSSGALIELLKPSTHILVTATRNGNEKNATIFGTFFATSLSNITADLNKNNTISIQEAFEYASHGVTNFFDSSVNLATEHPQIRGQHLAQFILAKLTQDELSNSDPQSTQLLKNRLAIDQQISLLQQQREEYSDTEYFEKLQTLILESAMITEQINEGNFSDSE